MKNLEFTQKHYDQMVVNDEDYKTQTFEEVQKSISEGARLIEENKGFANIDTKLNETEFAHVGAFIDFRLAKQDLGEYVEEIDN